MFAPLAKLLGVYCIKEELEELSLQYSEPELYNHIRRWQDKQAAEQHKAFAAGKSDLEALLASDSYLQGHARGWTVRVRQKPAYSIYKQLLQLQRSKATTQTSKLQEAVASGSVAAAAEAFGGAIKRAMPPGKGASSSRGGQPSAASAAATTNAGASSSSSGSGRGTTSNSRQAGAGAGKSLLAHLKELPERGVYLQVCSSFSQYWTINLSFLAAAYWCSWFVTCCFELAANNWTLSLYVLACFFCCSLSLLLVAVA